MIHWVASHLIFFPFGQNKRDNCLYARVKGFHRLNEIPASWYPYFQDRNNIASK